MFNAEVIKTALNSLRANKVRAVLTMLGVVIGVFSVTSLVSIGIGIQNFISGQFESIGSNLIIVAPGKVDVGDDPAKSFSKNKLDSKHIDLINKHAKEYVEFVSPSIRLGNNVEYKTNSYNATVVGGNTTALAIFNFEIEKGRAYTKSEEISKKRVAVLGHLVNKELFGTSNSLGKRVKLGEESYEVVGVIKEKGSNFDDRVAIPYTTMQESFDIKNYTNIGIKARNGVNIDTAIKQIELALLRDLDEDDFSVLSQQEILSSITNVLQILTTGLGAIAGISLLVGGIGIMNIMLVSVTERIREIGLRKALGATSYNIGLQFLIEAVTLSVTGGMIGVFLGWIASLVARSYVKTYLPLGTVFVAFGFALVVGVVFGTYPAIKASKKDPIEALRFE